MYILLGSSIENIPEQKGRLTRKQYNVHRYMSKGFIIAS